MSLRRLLDALGPLVDEFPAPAVEIHQHWHTHLTNDPAHQWLRNCTRTIADRLPPPST